MTSISTLFFRGSRRRDRGMPWLLKVMPPVSSRLIRRTDPPGSPMSAASATMRTWGGFLLRGAIQFSGVVSQFTGTTPSAGKASSSEKRAGPAPSSRRMGLPMHQRIVLFTFFHAPCTSAGRSADQIRGAADSGEIDFNHGASRPLHDGGNAGEQGSRPGPGDRHRRVVRCLGGT